MPMPSKDRLREILNYQPETGVFTWKPRKGCRSDRPLGTGNGNGYLSITVDGVRHYSHRLAWVYMWGDIPTPYIDHVNGVRDDNRIENLRPATPAENQRYRSTPQKNSRSGVIGVSWHAHGGKWQVHKHKRYLGLFDTVEEAVKAWEQA